MVFFAWKKKFYWRESLLVGALFSMISLFAATLSETLFLPFLFVFFYVARNVLCGQKIATKLSYKTSSTTCTLWSKFNNSTP
jgi:hypothetical protein